MVEAPNETTTDATGNVTGGAGEVTDIVADPLVLFATAVMVAVPVATPVIAPLSSIVATDGLELDHVTVLVDDVSPLANVTCATACVFSAEAIEALLIVTVICLIA